MAERTAFAGSARGRQRDGRAPRAARRTPDVIAPGHTFDSVTDKIAGILLTHRTPLGWFLGLRVASFS